MATTSLPLHRLISAAEWQECDLDWLEFGVLKEKTHTTGTTTNGSSRWTKKDAEMFSGLKSMAVGFGDN